MGLIDDNCFEVLGRESVKPIIAAQGLDATHDDAIGKVCTPVSLLNIGRNPNGAHDFISGLVNKFVAMRQD
jgi:hypothetical protein